MINFSHITKDEKGKVLSVEDKDGKPVDVERYISTHTRVVNNDSPGTSGGSEKSAESNTSSRSNGSGISGDTGGKSSSGNGSGSSDSGTSDRGENIEE